MSLADIDRRYGDAIENGMAIGGPIALALLVILCGLQVIR